MAASLTLRPDVWLLPPPRTSLSYKHLTALLTPPEPHGRKLFQPNHIPHDGVCVCVCVCVLYNWCVMLKWDQAQVSQRGNCFTTWIRASVEWGSRGKLDLWGSHSVSSTSFVSCQTNVSPHQHKVFALSILYRGCIVHLNLLCLLCVLLCLFMFIV